MRLRIQRIVVSSASSYTPASLLPLLFKLNPRPSRIWPCITLGSICVLYVSAAPTQHTWLFTYTDSSLHTNNRNETSALALREVGNLHCSGDSWGKGLVQQCKKQKGGNWPSESESFVSNMIHTLVLIQCWYFLVMKIWQRPAASECSILTD